MEDLLEKTGWQDVEPLSALTDVALQSSELTLISSPKWLTSHRITAALGLVWKGSKTCVSGQDFRANTEQKDSAKAGCNHTAPREKL